MRITGSVFGVIAAVVIVLDQITKFLAVGHLTDAFGGVQGGLDFGAQIGRFLETQHPRAIQTIEVVENFWRWRYAENPGAAFSFLAGVDAQIRHPFFITITIAAGAMILVYFRKSHPAHHLQRLALALVFGGAVGNFIDRVRLHYVIDFISWHWYDKYTWPTFNIADAAISVGVVLLLLAYKEPETDTIAQPAGSS